MVQKLIAGALVVYALFFSLFPHTAHCRVVEALGMTCPSHWVHILSGIAAFLIAVWILQRNSPAL